MFIVYIGVRKDDTDDIERRVTDLWAEETQKLEASMRSRAGGDLLGGNFQPGMQPDKTEKTPRAQAFDDPKAREHFAGLRRGQIEKAVLNSSRRARSTMRAGSPYPEEVSEASRSSRRSKSLDARRQNQPENQTNA